MIRTNKQLIVCLAVCLVVSFVTGVYAAPPVEVIRGPAVTVVNPVSKPIPVTEVNQQPIAKEVTLRICAPCGLNCTPPCNLFHPGWLGNGTIYTVPPGKRLVIEYLSCNNVGVVGGVGAHPGSYSTSYSCYIHLRTAGEYVTHWLPTTPYGHPTIQDIEQQITNPAAFLSVGQRVQLYADPVSDVVVGAYRQNNARTSNFDYDEQITFSFSGYLVDAALPVDTGPQ